ncbi:hypothetical protein NIES2100_46540 [Calothrix sp. NIES-2100]|uniref:PEP-CTERM sorting domain-containing protein n=1 Tax=Calothrix sp. NIES-2100 TaxID=1954172 RepID=UPI000B61FA16|nr:hypothetical protein NIES2100_46540 [Calothrix sp. NIES-2100]
MKFKSLSSKILFSTVISIPTSITVLFSLPVFAANIGIQGGICEFTDFSTGGLLLAKNCINKTKVEVNDIHLSIQYLDDDGNPIETLNRSYNDKFQNIKPGGTYPFPGILNWVVYDNNDIFNAGQTPNFENLQVSGYWTKDGKKVPEPLTILGSATALAMGINLKKRYSKKVEKQTA